MRPATVFKVYVYCYLLGCVIVSSLFTSHRKNCISTCQLFPALCKNNGKCKESEGHDCQWYCECPANCEGLFCEKVVTGGDSPRVEVKVIIEKERKVDVASSGRSVLAEALKKLHSMVQAEAGKPPEPPKIDRIGKTITVKENKTASIICPPGVLKGKKSETSASTTSSVSETTTTMSSSTGVRDNVDTTTDGTSSVTSVTTESQTTEQTTPIVTSMDVTHITTTPTVHNTTRGLDENITQSIPSISEGGGAKVVVSSFQNKFDQLKNENTSENTALTESTAKVPSNLTEVTSTPQSLVTTTSASNNTETATNQTETYNGSLSNTESETTPTSNERTTLTSNAETVLVTNKVVSSRTIPTTSTTLSPERTSVSDNYGHQGSVTPTISTETVTTTHQVTTTNVPSFTEPGSLQPAPRKTKLSVQTKEKKLTTAPSSSSTSSKTPESTSSEPFHTTTQTTEAPPANVSVVNASDTTTNESLRSTTTEQYTSSVTENTSSVKTTTAPIVTSENSLGSSEKTQTAGKKNIAPLKKDKETTLKGQVMPGLKHIDIFSEAQINSNQLMDSVKSSELGLSENNIKSGYDILQPGLSANAEKENNLLVDNMMSST